MSKYRPIDTRLWNDRKFLSLSGDGRLLWVFFLTSPTTLPIPGVILGGEAALAEQLGWTTERYRNAFAELLAKQLRIRCEGRLVWLPNAIRYQPPRNPNMVKGWSETWDDIPECQLKAELWEALKIACKGWSQLFGRLFRHPFAEQTAEQLHQDQEQKQDQDQDQEQEREEDAHVRERHPAVGKVARSVWNHGAVVRGDLAESNVQVPPWAATPGTQNKGWTALLDRVGELLVDSTPEQAELVCVNRVNVAAAKARKDGDGNWFTSASMFSANSFELFAHLDPKQFGRKAPKRRPGEALGSALPRNDHPDGDGLIPINEIPLNEVRS